MPVLKGTRYNSAVCYVNNACQAFKLQFQFEKTIHAGSEEPMEIKLIIGRDDKKVNFIGRSKTEKEAKQLAAKAAVDYDFLKQFDINQKLSKPPRKLSAWNPSLISFVNNTCQSNGLKIKFLDLNPKANSMKFETKLTISDSKKTLIYYGRSNERKQARLLACRAAVEDNFLQKFNIKSPMTSSLKRTGSTSSQLIEIPRQDQTDVNNNSTGDSVQDDRRLKAFLSSLTILPHSNYIYSLYLTGKLLNTELKAEFGGRHDSGGIIVKLKYGKFRSVGK